ncbi:restriction endonuclease subunit S [Parafannyhessea umbonata]|uniref:restriction endonuclease subunit S n=1 Tax=Parafannyhessea umbonata TaxID=604330 RepID=UPI0026EBA8FE|nr:restriction endonuclease subunit S [Parafannyhessea umbonata]MCI7219599.1 restriction endonuclease subunit S [Parafannyhessea umbonata]
MTSKPPFDGEVMRLGDIAKVSAGNVAPKKSAFCDSGKPFVRAGSLSGLLAGGSVQSLERIDDKTAERLGFRLFPAGTVVFAKSGMSCLKGYVYTLPEECYVVSHLACVTPSADLSKYLEHYFNYNRPNRLIENPSFPSIKLSQIEDIQIRLPEKSIRDKQVGRLEAVIDLVDICKDAESRFDDLVKSRFVEMFGTLEHPRYTIVELQDICAYIVDCPHETPKYDGMLEYPAIRTSELVGTTIDWSSMKYVSEEEYQRRTRRLIPQPGDIVYAREGTYGSAAILPDGYRFCLGQRTMLFRADASVCLPQYLLFAITSPDVKGQADLLNVGSTVPHVNVKDAKRFRIPLPSLALQREFADFATRVDKLRVEAQVQKEKLQTLYDSLAQDYFAI